MVGGAIAGPEGRREGEGEEAELHVDLLKLQLGIDIDIEGDFELGDLVELRRRLPSMARPNFYFGQEPAFGINSQAPTQANTGRMQTFEQPNEWAGNEYPQTPPGTVNMQQLLLTPPGQNGHQRHSTQHATRAPQHPFITSHPSYRPLTSRHGRQQRTYDVHDLIDTGPKQSRKPAPNMPPTSIDDIKANIPRFDPRITLGGAKAAMKGGNVEPGIPSNPDSQSATDQADTGDEVGMSRFMSDLHRTVNRDSVPQKKRKSETNDEDEDTPEHKKPKSTFGGIAKGGVISEHIRAEREKAAAEAGPSNTAIDLTADDDDGKGKDDELVFMGETQKKNVSEENKEVCLGGLQGKANISRIPMYSDRALAGLGKETWPRLKLEHRRSEQSGQNNLQIELLDRAGRVIGFIEYRVAAALVPLLHASNTNHLRITVWLSQWPRGKMDKPGQHVSKHLDIQIILYAPRKHTSMIGKYLSQKQLFLTSLAGVYTGKEIENPHVPINYGGRGERMPQMPPPVRQIVRDPGELRREAQGMFDKMIKHEDLAEMEAEPSIIKTPLLPHQKQALQFMTDREHTAPAQAGEAPAFSLWKPERNARGHDVWVHVITGQEEANEPKPVYGGILADMMGLGKTLSILSLIAHTKREAETFGQAQPPRSANVERNAKTTVIICPKSVMSNWQEQIKIHVVNKKLTYYNYHGSNRHQDLDELAKYDIILTTYGTTAEDLKAKGKALFQMNWFRIVLDEAHGIRNQNTGVSKACIALTAERRWAVTGTPVQNGLNDMGALVKFLRIYPFDHSHTWNQHIIIPLKSGNTDVIAHLRLLVDSITLRRLKDKIGLKDRKEVESHLDFSDADRKVYERIANQSSRDMMLMTGGKSVMKGKAYAHMLRLIDRMRRYCAHGLDMFNDEDRKQIAEGMNPDNAIAVDLGDEPDYEPYEFIGKQQAYETLHLINESDTDRCENCGNKLSDKALDVEGNGDTSGEEDEASSDNGSDDSDATTNKADDILGYLTPCFHVLCPNCKDHYIEHANKTMTADQRHECTCSAFVRFGLFEFHRSGLHDYLADKAAKTRKRNGRRIWDETNYNGPSAKVLALLSDLQLAATESADLEALGEPPIRSVVFSQWTSYLDLIEVALEEHEIHFTRLDGTMSVGQRTRVMEQFKTDPAITVILVSIKAGGQGLNFTAASRVFMMEPQYNPGVEQQAIDRVHRLGQKREVLITHYFIAGTIEQKIQVLQRRKEDLARFALERRLSRVEEARKRIEGLRDLFR
ncbi:hypothetical protein LTS02_003994 [Friedmanniomyces endolithicus]|nr:hypothetical protein LTS02_003994 [Friedmanniomyces endolithicus]